MKNYYDKQRNSVMDQIDYLYDEKDVTFRGFRFNVTHTSLQNLKPKDTGKFLNYDGRIIKW